MSNEATPSKPPLVPAALAACRAALWSGVGLAALALVFAFIAISMGEAGPFAVTAVLLMLAAPLLAAAAIIAGLGARTSSA